MAFRDACLDELATICLRQVDPCPPAKPELDGYFGPNFKAARPNSGPDRDLEVLRPRPEALTHCLHGFGPDFQSGTSPACVNGGHGLMSNIRHQDRQAVGGSNGQQDSRCIRNQGIALADYASGIGREDIRGVHLLKGSHRHAGGPSLRGAGTESVL